MVVVSRRSRLAGSINSTSFCGGARNGSGFRVALARAVVVFDGDTRDSRSNVSTYFFGAAPNCTPTPCGLDGWRSGRLADRLWFRVPSPPGRESERLNGLGNRTAVYSDVRFIARCLVRNRQTLRSPVQFALLFRATPRDSPARFHGFRSRHCGNPVSAYL